MVPVKSELNQTWSNKKDLPRQKGAVKGKYGRVKGHGTNGEQQVPAEDLLREAGGRQSKADQGQNRICHLTSHVTHDKFLPFAELPLLQTYLLPSVWGPNDRKKAPKCSDI